jgi:hypothetical protein
MVYIIRYEEVELGTVCELLEEYGGYFDADARVAVVENSPFSEQAKAPEKAIAPKSKILGNESLKFSE